MDNRAHQNTGSGEEKKTTKKRTWRHNVYTAQFMECLLGFNWSCLKRLSDLSVGILLLPHRNGSRCFGQRARVDRLLGARSLERGHQCLPAGYPGQLRLADVRPKVSSVCSHYLKFNHRHSTAVLYSSVEVRRLSCLSLLLTVETCASLHLIKCTFKHFFDKQEFCAQNLVLLYR